MDLSALQAPQPAEGAEGQVLIRLQRWVTVDGEEEGVAREEEGVEREVLIHLHGWAGVEGGTEAQACNREVAQVRHWGETKMKWWKPLEVVRSTRLAAPVMWEQYEPDLTAQELTT